MAEMRSDSPNKGSLWECFRNFLVPSKSWRGCAQDSAFTYVSGMAGGYRRRDHD